MFLDVGVDEPCDVGSGFHGVVRESEEVAELGGEMGRESKSGLADNLVTVFIELGLLCFSLGDELVGFLLYLFEFGADDLHLVLDILEVFKKTMELFGDGFDNGNSSRISNRRGSGLSSHYD